MYKTLLVLIFEKIKKINAIYIYIYLSFVLIIKKKKLVSFIFISNNLKIIVKY
jgi:hypothetical protein